MNIFYIYIYLNPRKPGRYCYENVCFLYKPFYVGKGKNGRWKEIKWNRTKHFNRIINKIKSEGLNPIIIKLRENLEENESFKLEIELIKLIGKEKLKEGPLTNVVDGGEGISGYEHTEETLEKSRKEYSIIKESFEGKYYDLLTEEKDYKNSKQKLEYIHKECGRKHSIRWNDFQQGKGCPYCARNKIDFPEIKNAFEKIKYNLKTEEKDYENAHQKLDYECSKGHKHSICSSNFQQGNRCPYCEREKQRRKKYLYTKKEFKKINFTLLTEEKDYKSNKQKLEYFDKYGQIFSISWSYFQNKISKNINI